MSETQIQSFDKTTRIALCAHVLQGLPSEFENFSLFLTSKKVAHVTVAHPLGDADLFSEIFWHSESPPPSKRRKARRSKSVVFRSVWEILCTWRFARSDVWIAFNSVALLAGGWRPRKSTRVLWFIDLVPDRGSRIENFGYKWLERIALSRADIVIENNEIAAKERRVRAGKWLSPRTRTHICPITVDRSIFFPDLDAQIPFKIGFLGSLNDRTGADRLVPIFEEIKRRIPSSEFEIVGSGNMLETVQQQALASPFSASIVVHGFVESEALVATIVRTWAVGLAPFKADDSTWTKFADPQKLKIYLASGVIPVVTDVPPIAADISSKGIGVSLPSLASNADFGEAVCRILESNSQQDSMREQARKYCLSFDRNHRYEEVWRIIEELS